MVILDLMRLMGGLAQDATGEIEVHSPADRELAERWCERSSAVVRAEVDEAGAGTRVVRRGRAPDPADVLGADRLPGVRLWLYTNFRGNLACDCCCVASSPQAPAANSTRTPRIR
jgi:hypothetical protein